MNRLPRCPRLAEKGTPTANLSSGPELKQANATRIEHHANTPYVHDRATERELAGRAWYLFGTKAIYLAHNVATTCI